MPATSRVRHAGAGLLLLLCGAALLAPMLTYPFGRDQGVFACGADVLRRGGALYRDVWDLKPPGIYYLYSLSLAAFGHSMLAPRILDLLWTLATAGVLVAIGARALSPWVGAAGAFLFLCRYALGFDYWHTAQADGFASLPLALAVLLMLKAERGPPGEGAEANRGATPGRRARWWLAAASGALVGAAIVIKLTLGVLLVVPLYHLVRSQRDPRAERLARAAGYLAGTGAMVGAAAAFVWSTGALNDMIAIVFTWNARYAAIRPSAPAPVVIAYQTWGFLFGGKYVALKLIGGLGVIGLVDAVRRQPEPLGSARLRGLVALWFGVMAAQVWVQGKYFGYHWLPALPPLGLLAGQGLATVWRLLHSRAKVARGAWALAGAGMVAMATCVGAAYWGQFAGPIRYIAGSLSRPGFLADFRDRRDFSLSADLEVASFLRTHTSPETPVFVWGFEPIIYFLSERAPASRFISQQPLVAPWSPRAWRRELVDDLTRARPGYILVVHNDQMPWVTMRVYDSAEELSQYPELVGLLRRDYRGVGMIEDFDLWVRRGAGNRAM